jgi:hypothetical protein
MRQRVKQTVGGAVTYAALLVATPDWADSRFYMSQEDLTIETASRVVRHVHTTDFAQLPSGETGFELESTLEVRESSGALVTHQRVMPMTALVHIGRGYIVASICAFA